MELLGERLGQAGFTVHNVGYPSREKSSDELVALLGVAVNDCRAESNEPVHFVTHSMGGILVRAYLGDGHPHSLGRVVQLAPPNHGSELVDHLGDLAELLGPTGRLLGTEAHSLPNQLGPPDYDLGVITGDSCCSPLSGLIPGPDDGRVSVESARLEGARDFLVLEAGHSFIMRRADVAVQVSHFLETGQFVHVAARR